MAVRMVRVTTRSDLGNRDRIARAIEDGDAFASGGSLSGRPGGSRELGRMLEETYFGSDTAGEVAALFVAEIAAALYVVFSCATPIAWLTADGCWVVSDGQHSVSTSRQQSLMRMVGRVLDREAAKAVLAG